MKKLTFIFAFLFVCLFASAQTSTTPKYTVPDEYSFVLPEDYTTYEPQVKEAIDWYLWRSMGLDNDKRQKASNFFMQWVIGTSAVTIEIEADKIVTFGETNPSLLIPFCMGWAKYSLENGKENRVKGCAAGIQATVIYYNKNRASMNKDESIEKYEKMIKDNKLEKYISKNLPPKDLKEKK